MSIAQKAMKPLSYAMLPFAMMVAQGNNEAQAQQFLVPSFRGNQINYYSPGNGAAGNQRTFQNGIQFQNEINRISAGGPRGNFNRRQGQSIASPQGNLGGRTTINTPGFSGTFQSNTQNNYQNSRQQGNYQYNNNTQNQQQYQINRPDPSVEVRKAQIKNAKTSQDGSFKYVNNLIMKRKTGKLYYSEYSMIMPQTKDFKLPEMKDMRRGKDANGKYFYLVTNDAVESAYKKDVEASSTKAPTQTTYYLRQHCCCCCN